MRRVTQSSVIAGQVALLTLSAVALADPPDTETSICVVAFERGQTLRREGALRRRRTSSSSARNPPVRRS